MKRKIRTLDKLRVGDSFDVESRIAVSERLALTLSKSHSPLDAGACQARVGL